MPLSAPDTPDVHTDLIRGAVRPTRVFHECERPVVFETLTDGGRPLLAYLSDEQPHATWFVMAATAPAILDDLEHGRISVRQALTTSWMWLVRTDPVDQVTGAWSVTEAQIPEQRLPRPGTRLLPEH
jgi:hypothetical protein